MKLTADSINGVLIIDDFNILGGDEFFTIVDEITFYDSLDKLKPSDLIIASEVSLGMAKCIHAEYGITRIEEI